MPIIIDGWNFIRDERSDIDDEEGDAVSSARQLISYLESFQETHNDPITVVFDSSKEFLDTGYKSNTRLKVVPSKDADDYIKRYIDQFPEKQRRNLRVISSDTDVYYYAKSSYATPIRCAEFWGKLEKALTKGIGADRINKNKE